MQREAANRCITRRSSRRPTRYAACPRLSLVVSQLDRDSTMKHKWTECDDIVILYIHNHGTSLLGLSLDDIASTLSIPVGSIKMRIQNVENIAGGRGLQNAAKLSRSVFAEYSQLPESELRSIAIDCLGKQRSDSGTG